MDQRSSYLKAIAAFVFFLLLTGGGIYWYRVGQKREGGELRERIQLTQEKRRAGNLDESIAELERELKEAPTKDLEARIRNHLAFDLRERNEGDDRRRAVMLFKENVDDPLVPTNWKAHSLNAALNMIGGQDLEFAREVLFSKEAFGSFLENGSIGLAFRRGYEKSFEYYPTAMAAFLAGYWYVDQLRNPATSSHDKEIFLAELKRWVQLGEGLLTAAEKGGYEKTAISSIYKYAAYDYRTIAFISRAARDREKAEEYFRRSREILDSEDTVYTFVASHTNGFDFAAFLWEAYGQNRIAEISSLLTFPEPRPEYRDYPIMFYEFLASETKPGHERHLHHRDILTLRDNVPEFREFLKERGLEYSE